MSELSFGLKLGTYFFTTAKQAEFLDNYLSLKGGDNEIQSPDKEVFHQIKEIYGEINSPSCFEVKVCDYVIDKISQGERVDMALAPFLNRDVVLAFKATYEVGKTEYGLRQVIKNINQQSELKKAFNKKVRGGFMIFVIGIVFMLMISTFALPQILAMVDISELDSLTYFYNELGIFLKKSGEKIVYILLVIFAIFKFSQPNLKGDLRELIEKSPLGVFYKTYRSFSANRFFNMLTLLKSSGLSLRQSLEIIDGEVTPYLQHHIDEMLEMTRNGISNLEQLDTGLLTPRLRIRLKAAGNKSSDSIDEVFSNIAAKASDDFEKGISMTGDTLKFWLFIAGLSLAVMSILVMVSGAMSVAASY